MTVDKNAVLKAIKLAIDSGIHAVNETDDPEIGHTYGAHIRSLSTVSPMNSAEVHAVMATLQQQSDLSWLMKSSYNPGPGDGGVGVLPVKVANWLLAKALRLHGGPEEALSKLESFAKENSVDGLRIVVIYGIHVKDLIEIDGATTLVPLSMLQPSLGMDGLSENLGGSIYHLPMVQTGVGLPEPAIAAIVQRFRMAPALRKGDDKEPPWFSAHQQAFKDLEDLASATVLVPGAMPQVVSRWVEITPIDAIPGLTGGPTGEFEFMEVIPKRFNFRMSLPTEAIRDCLAKFSKLNPEVRSRLAIPLRRLALFQARRDLTDKAVELGIALEALLGNEDASGEITHKVSVRGAIFVEKDRAKRKATHADLKKAYGLRSQAVHTGKFQRKAESTAPDVLSRAAEVVRLVMTRIVNDGAFPDWTDVDLDTNLPT